MKKSSLFTSESVSEGHPDKVADQISDAILDAFLAKDESAKTAIETLVTTGQVIVAGEVRSSAYVDIQSVVRSTIKRIGYTKPEYGFDDSCGIISLIHEQSSDIRRGVERENPLDQGAGDQGMMFGYATDETETFMPLPLYLANLIVAELAYARKKNIGMYYLRPDSKSQVTVEYDEDGKATHIDTIVVSTQHDEFPAVRLGVTNGLENDEAMHKVIEDDVKNLILERVKNRIKNETILAMFDDKTKVLVNPTGKFVIGGPNGDTGLTGRKIIVDTYGGKGAHGGGAFSGKDPSKVDRSAAYMARYVAKNMVAAGVAKEMLVQLSYAIGVAQPVSVNVNTFGTNQTAFSDAELAGIIEELFDLRPKAIEEKLELRHPIYEETAAYGHFGRECTSINKTIEGETYGVALFTWEALDAVEQITDYFKTHSKV